MINLFSFVVVLRAGFESDFRKLEEEYNNSANIRGFIERIMRLLPLQFTVAVRCLIFTVVVLLVLHIHRLRREYPLMVNGWHESEDPQNSSKVCFVVSPSINLLWLILFLRLSGPVIFV